MHFSLDTAATMATIGPVDVCAPTLEPFSSELISRKGRCAHTGIGSGLKGFRVSGRHPNEPRNKDWMNETAAMERSNSRGWHAKYQLRCDCCGRFVLPGMPGSSWVIVPCTDIDSGDERERCAACTKKHGPAKAMPGYVEHLVQGVVPDARQPE